MFGRMRKTVAATAAASLLVLQGMAVPVGAEELEGQSVVNGDGTPGSSQQDPNVPDNPPDGEKEGDADGGRGDTGAGDVGNSDEGNSDEDNSDENNDEEQEDRAFITVEGLDTELSVNRPYNFTVRTEKRTVEDSPTVKAVFTVGREGTEEDDVHLCYYSEDGTDEETCKDLPLTRKNGVLVGEFNPSLNGFPLADESTKLKVTFTRAGDYEVALDLVSVEDASDVYATFKKTYQVKLAEPKVATNLPGKILKGKQREFTLNVDSGSYADTSVTGTVEITGPNDMDPKDFTLSYKASPDAKYSDLGLQGANGNFSASFGGDKFTLDHMTRYFRITPMGVGTYHLTVKYTTDAGDVFASEPHELQVVEGKPTVSFSLPSTLNIGKKRNFKVKLTAGDFAGTDAYLRFKIEGKRISTRDVDLWYDDGKDCETLHLEKKDGDLIADYEFDGFALTDQEIDFRIRFEEEGDYDVTVELLEKGTGYLLASDTESVEVEDPDDEKDAEDDEEEDKNDSKPTKPTEPKPSTPAPSTPTTPEPTQPDRGQGTPEDPAVIRDNNTHGTTTAVVSDGAATVTHEVTSAPTAGSLVIDMKGATVPVLGKSVPVAEWVVAVPVSVISQFGSDQGVIFQAGASELHLSPAALRAVAAGQGDAKVQFGLKTADVNLSAAAAEASGLSLAGQAVSLSAGVVSGTQVTPVSSFANPVTLRLPIDAFQVPQHLGIYRLVGPGEWMYVGGRVNSAGRSVEADVSAPGTYAVFEYTQEFTDIADHWARADIQLLASRHIVKGKQPGIFDPEAQVTRAEFTALLVRALGLKGAGVAQPTFTDVTLSHWSCSEVETAVQNGLVARTDQFRPEDPISRQEMAVMVSRAMTLRGVPQPGVPAESVLVKYKDRGRIAGWAQEAVSHATQRGVITGYPTGRFEPEATATRAEAVTVLKRLMIVTGDLRL